jgi:hypothetical protein
MLGPTTPSAQDGEQSIDLQQLSDAIYRRNRSWRLLAGVLGISCFAGLSLLGITGLVSATPLLLLSGRVALAAAAILGGVLCFSVAWIPVRYLAHPPVSLSVSTYGLSLRFSSGQFVRVAWEEPRIDLGLVERRAESPSNISPVYRMWLSAGKTGTKWPWQRVIPLTYMPNAAAKRVLEEARKAGLSIEELGGPESRAYVARHN